MSPPRRVFRVLAVAFALGLALAWAKGQNTDGRHLTSQLRGALGNLSTPWLLIPFAAGSVCVRARWAALVGLLATMAALGGFYLLSTLVEDLGGHGFVGDLRLEVLGNRAYLESGLVVGPVLGWLGAWWKQSRRRGSTLVAGALLMAEPIALFTVSALRSGHLLPPTNHLPVEVRIVTSWSINGTTQAAVYLGEFVAGLVVVALVRVRTHHRGSHYASGAGQSP